MIPRFVIWTQLLRLSHCMQCEKFESTQVTSSLYGVTQTRRRLNTCSSGRATRCTNIESLIAELERSKILNCGHFLHTFRRSSMRDVWLQPFKLRKRFNFPQEKGEVERWT